MSKFIVVTGGVVSGLGKGITSASIGALLESHGVKVGFIKLDPYLNVDPGTMNPFQHGEVYVTADGAETDMDLGHYERFTKAQITKYSNTTSGKIYSAVIEAERRGDYLGKTVQVIPHVTDEIKGQIFRAAQNVDVCIVEIGGTVGDIESLPFLEAVRQLSQEASVEEICYVHLTLVPYLASSNELKTKPTQHSVQKLREIGIVPDILICRADHDLNEDLLAKISLFCSMRRSRVFSATDCESIYDVPIEFWFSGMVTEILNILKIPIPDRVDMSRWTIYQELRQSGRPGTRVVVITKYLNPKESYKSISEAISHAATWLGMSTQIEFIDASHICGFGPAGQAPFEFGPKDVLLIPGGFGGRNTDHMVQVIQMARELNVPMLGICLGMQLMAIAHARSACNLTDADSTEWNPQTPHPVITLMNSQTAKKNVGGTMRLGTYSCELEMGTATKFAYNEDEIHERHRHRFEFNFTYEDMFKATGMVVSGRNKELGLVECMEYTDQKFAVGVQFHPEFNTKPGYPHPLFVALLKARP